MDEKKLQGIASFQIDDTLSAKQASENFLDDYELNFQDFLERTVGESTAEDFSYSNKAVKKAGRNLRKEEGDLKSAMAIIQKFRAAHEKPLNTMTYLVGRCCRELSINVKPVSRLKRLETIIDKLQRKSLDGHTTNATCVTNMNDIGGCRVIFPDLDSLNRAVYQLREAVEIESRVSIKNIDNYIENPKPNDCGYRSLHVIYRYKHCSGKNFNIEAQLRTRYQHLWATTVEIVDILEGTKIKTHSHSPTQNKTELQIKWERLLSIMSRYIASVEGALNITDEEEVRNSEILKGLDKNISALSKLRSFKVMSESINVSCSNDKAEHFVIIIDEGSLELIFSEAFEHYNQAISVYNAAEKVTQGNTKANTLLISTKNMGQLSEAYPNYLGDCTAFIVLLEKAMGVIP